MPTKSKSKKVSDTLARQPKRMVQSFTGHKRRHKIYNPYTHILKKNFILYHPVSIQGHGMAPLRDLKL